MKINATTQGKLDRELTELHHRLRLGVVMLVETNGQIVGFAGTEAPPTELASLLAGMIAASQAVTHRLGLSSPNQWAQWSENGGVVILPVGTEHALAVLFHNHRFPGWVRMQAVNSSTRLSHMIAESLRQEKLDASAAKDLPAGSRAGKLFGSVSDDEIDRLFSGV